MDLCTLAALIHCFTWSGFYIDGGLSIQDVGQPRQEWRTTEVHYPGVTETITQLVTVDDPMNPYGHFAIGYEIKNGAWRFYLEGRHDNSSLQTDDDHGVNSINAGFHWNFLDFLRR